MFAQDDLFGFGVLFKDIEGAFSLALIVFIKGAGTLAISKAIAVRQCLVYAQNVFHLQVVLFFFLHG